MCRVKVLLLLLLWLISGITASSAFTRDWFDILNRSQNAYKSSLMEQIFQDTPMDYHLRNSNIESRLRSVEQRLRSIEQPLWRLGMAATTDWDRCTEGGCHCDASNKRLSCWRNMLRVLPVNQYVPNDVLTMWERKWLNQFIVPSFLRPTVYSSDLSLNYLTTLHRDSFRGLAHLSSLDLSTNRIDFIPEGLLADLENLITLRLHRNQLINLDDAAVFYKLPHLANLDMSYNNLRELPEGLFNFNPRLTLLNLSNNNLTAIPEPMTELGALEELHLNYNQLVELPGHAFSGLQALKMLHLGNNQILNVSGRAFGDLFRLEYLNLASNRLERITEEVFNNLTNLSVLDLTLNKISLVGTERL